MLKATKKAFNPSHLKTVFWQTKHVFWQNIPSLSFLPLFRFKTFMFCHFFGMFYHFSTLFWSKTFLL
jgi:hypothetical protein